MTDAAWREIREKMEGATGSVTLHCKDGKLMKVEYRIIETPKLGRPNRRLA